MQNPRIEELVRRDPRYAPEAYQFVFDALDHATRRRGRVRSDAPPPPPSAAAGGGEGGVDEEHVSVPQFLDGVRELALREFGLMAPTVFAQWGVRRTDDLGEIVFSLVSAGLMDPDAADDRGAFHERFDLGDGLVDGYRIEGGEGLEGPP
jgi:uncharacterized repeat protein (TIGR04138 family)